VDVGLYVVVGVEELEVVVPVDVVGGVEVVFGAQSDQLW